MHLIHGYHSSHIPLVGALIPAWKLSWNNRLTASRRSKSHAVKTRQCLTRIRSGFKRPEFAPYLAPVGRVWDA